MDSFTAMHVLLQNLSTAVTTDGAVTDLSQTPTHSSHVPDGWFLHCTGNNLNVLQFTFLISRNTDSLRPKVDEPL